jgi:hypothetical protein
MKTSIANCRLQISKCKLNIEGAIGRWLPYAISQRGVILKFALCILKFEIRSFAHIGLCYFLHLVGLRRSFARVLQTPQELNDEQNWGLCLPLWDQYRWNG